MKFNIAEAREQLQFARDLANARVEFMVVPITSEEEKHEFAHRILRNIQVIDEQRKAEEN